VTKSVEVGICHPKLLVGFVMFSPYQATIVAFSQSKVGDTLFQRSVIGTSFQRIACNE
jgi:hypothetical protein